MDFLDPKTLLRIEGHSEKRVTWLKKKILSEELWTRPLCVERTHLLVLDGHHRLAVSLSLGLACVPCELFDYGDVEVWSLRDNHEVSRELVTERSVAGDLYPYKTAKHRFPREISTIAIALNELYGEK